MRSPRQVFDDHWDSILSGDMSRILSDYASDAVFVTPGRVARGHAEIQSVFDGIGDDLGEMALNQESVTVGDSMILFEWSGKAAGGRTARGADAFYVEDGFVQYQTLNYSVTAR
jgi:ketosteroid isomerase-like protein